MAAARAPRRAARRARARTSASAPATTAASRARERALAAAPEQRRLRAPRARSTSSCASPRRGPSAGAVGPRLLWPTGACSARAGASRRSSASRPSTSTCASSRRARALLNGFYCGEFAHDERAARRLADGRLPARAREPAASARRLRRGVLPLLRGGRPAAPRWPTRAARPGSTPRPRSCTCGAARRRARSALDAPRAGCAATCATSHKHVSGAAAARARQAVLLAGLRLRAPRDRAPTARPLAGSRARDVERCSLSRRVTDGRRYGTGPVTHPRCRASGRRSRSSCGRTSAIPLFVAALAPPAPAAGARGRGLPAARRARDRRLQRGRRDRGQARERARARLPARAAAHRRRLGRLERRHRRDRAGLRRPRRRARARAARRQGQRAERHAVRALPTSTSSRSRTPTASGSPDALAQPRRAARRPARSPTSAAGCSCARPEGTNQEGAYWRYELWLRARESLDALGDRRQRLDLRRAPRALRGGRPALRPRPLVPVPDGQARLPRGLRAATRSRSRR